jgi:hypothetical protein
MSNYDLLALLAMLGAVVAAATVLRAGRTTTATAPLGSGRTKRGRR